MYEKWLEILRESADEGEYNFYQVEVGPLFFVPISTEYVNLVAGSLEVDFIEVDNRDSSGLPGISNVIYGFAGADEIKGGQDRDIIYGGDGHLDGSIDDSSDNPVGFVDDELFGRGGDDQIYGEAGNDRIFGGEGDDILVGGVGNDRLVGNEDNDVLWGSFGEDTLEGEEGNDLLHGDWLFTNKEEEQSDRLYSNDGNDELDGGSGDDTLFGESGDDLLDGGTGDDELDGGFADDSLVGGSDNDVLDGSYGDDTLVGFGDEVQVGEIDTLTGGIKEGPAGVDPSAVYSDTYVIGRNGIVYYDDGDSNSEGTGDHALVEDFVIGSDELELADLDPGEFYSLDVGTSGIATNLYFEDGSSVRELIAVFKGIDSSQVALEDFNISYT